MAVDVPTAVLEARRLVDLCWLIEVTNSNNGSAHPSYGNAAAVGLPVRP